METVLLKFEELSLDQLYDSLRLRADIFVVEQQCIYPDLDGRDQKAWHLLGTVGNELVAYTRIFAPGEYLKEASIGRVAVRASHRGQGLGQEIMREAMKAVTTVLGERRIAISAQSYLRLFYEELGFSITGPEFLEDEIPHLPMVWEADG